MSNLTQRFITSIIGAAVLITAMVWNEYSLILVLWSLSILVHGEYLRKIQKLKSGNINYTEYVLNMLIGLIVFSFVPLIIMDYDDAYIVLTLLIPFMFLFFIYELFTHREHAFQNIGLNITGIFYCVIPFELILATPLIINREYNSEGTFSNFQNENYFVLGYFLIVWTYDVMAYFTGRSFGKHKLFERISPKKTWEGFIGGFIFSIGGAIFISRYLHFLSLSDWIVIAIIISVFGTLGDLTESMLKRSLQLKDSSNILPGHGGFLDRFDATLIAAPFVWLYIALC